MKETYTFREMAERHKDDKFYKFVVDLFVLGKAYNATKFIKEHPEVILGHKPRFGDRRVLKHMRREIEEFIQAIECACEAECNVIEFDNIYSIPYIALLHDMPNYFLKDAILFINNDITNNKVNNG